MEVEPVKRRYITPDEALEVIREEHRWLADADEADPELDVSTSTTLAECEHWNAFGLRDWHERAECLNGLFDIKLPLREWKPVLMPLKKRTLGDACAFLSTKVRVPDVPSPTILGRPCSTAGAFLTVRSMLAEASVDTRDLRPSTPLNRYAAAGLPAIYLSLLAVAPRLLRSFRLHQRSYFWMAFPAAILLFATPLSVVGVAAGFPLFILVPPVTFWAFVWLWRHSEELEERSLRIEFDGLTDFRDLSYAVAGDYPPQRPRTRPPG